MEEVQFPFFSKTLNTNLCLFCQKRKQSEDCKSATEQGFATIQESAKARKLRIDMKYGGYLNQFLKLRQESIRHHRACYSDFTNKTLISRLPKRGVNTQQQSCSFTTDQVVDRSVCILCHNVKKGRLQKVTMDAALRIQELAKSDNNLNMRIRGTTANDLIVSQLLYHGLCLIDFERRSASAATTVKQYASFNDLCDELRISASRDVLKLKDVWQRYTDLCRSNNEDIPPSFVSRLSTFKEKLSKAIGDVFYFHQPVNRDIHEREMLLIPKQYLHEALLAKEDLCESSVNVSIATNENDIMDIVHTALKVRKSMSEHQNYAGLNVSKELAKSVVSDYLFLFLSVLAKGEEAIDEFFDKRDDAIGNDNDTDWDEDLDSDDDSDPDDDDDSEHEDERESDKRAAENFNNRILSVAQDIVYISGKGKQFTPKHVGLALTLHQKTRSRKLVSLFNKAGHCITYKQVLQIDRRLAELTLESLDIATGAVTPPNVVTYETAAKLYEDLAVPFVPVLHITADNIDLLTDTIDGKNTFHATQMVVFQRAGNSSGECLNSIQHRRGPSRLDIPEILNFLPENEILEQEPKFKSPVKLEWYNDSDSDEIKKARCNDFTFLYSRQEKPDAEKLGWTQFNKNISTNNLPLTASGFMPLILNPAHEYRTLETVLTRCIAVADKLNYHYVVLTVDQQLHIKLLDVKWSSPTFQERIILKMGGFHIACNYLKAIGQHMAYTGLAEIWIGSGVLAEGAALKVLNGKAYAKAMRIHKLTYQALWRILLPRFIVFLEENHHEVYEQIINMSNDTKLSMILHENCEINKYLETFFKKESEKNVNVSLWLTYMESVWILLMFTRSIRDGKWKLDTSILSKMLPLMARYDHNNYLKSMTVYIAEMKQLPKVVETAFECGDFVVKKTEAKFNQVDADHAQEWLVGTSKDSGGVVGITNNESTLQRWALSFHWRTEITRKTFDMYGLASNIGKHNEERPGRRKRDIKDENILLKYLLELKVLSHDMSSDQLQNAATKDVATSEIQVSLLEAYKEGHKEVVEFVKNRLILQDNDKPALSYNHTVSKVNAPTMADLFKPVNAVTVEKKLKTVDSKFLQHLSMAYEAGRKVDLQSILKHELHIFPLALTETNGNLRRGEQSILSNLLHKEVKCCSSLLRDSMTSHLIINGTEMVMDTQKLSTLKTFRDYGNHFISQIKQLASTYQRVDVLFDYEKRYSLQPRNCQNRSKLVAPIRRVIDNENVPLPQNMVKFLSLEANRADLANFLCEKLSVSAFENTNLVCSGFTDMKKVTSSDNSFNTLPLVANHESVNTRILLHVVNSQADKIVVYAKDAEVLLMIIHYFKRFHCEQIWLKTGTLKKTLYVPVHLICEKLSVDVKQNILAYHTLTGSYVTSYLYGITKSTGWKVFQENAKLLSALGENSLTSEDMAAIEQFFVKLYKVDDDIKTADQARYTLFRELKKFDDLPPTTDALLLHIKRAHYQTKIFKNCHLPDLPTEDPSNNGWRLNAQNDFEPILSTLPPIELSCENLKPCGCPKGKCINNRCKCRKAKNPCMAMCGCGAICNNSNGNSFL